MYQNCSLHLWLRINIDTFSPFCKGLHYNIDTFQRGWGGAETYQTSAYRLFGPTVINLVHGEIQYGEAGPA